MTSAEAMKFYFARLIAHEKTFMAFSNDFHGIFTIPGFIVYIHKKDLVNLHILSTPEPPSLPPQPPNKYPHDAKKSTEQWIRPGLIYQILTLFYRQNTAHRYITSKHHHHHHGCTDGISSRENC